MTSETIRKGSVLAVAAIAAVVSFLHIRHLALTHGGDRWSSALLPLAIDGAVVAATMSMIQARGFWKGWARCLLILAVGLTLAANMAYGWAHGPWGGILWAWPAVAFFGCAELAIGMARHAGSSRPEPAADASPAPASRPRAAPARQAAPGTAADDELARHAWLKAAERGTEIPVREMVRRYGRSRPYWAPRVEKWREETA